MQLNVILHFFVMLLQFFVPQSEPPSPAVRPAFLLVPEGVPGLLAATALTAGVAAFHFLSAGWGMDYVLGEDSPLDQARALGGRAVVRDSCSLLSFLPFRYFIDFCIHPAWLHRIVVWEF